MKAVATLIFVLVVAAMSGVFSAWFALDLGTGRQVVRAGAWTAYVGIAEVDSDPYSRAWLARSGAMPLTADEAISFVASQDGEGEPLSGRCQYQLIGHPIDSKWWTLTVSGDDGSPADNPANRYGVTSASVIRRVAGDYSIELAPVAQAGNWIPTIGLDRYQLILRLYDTQLINNGGLDTIKLPQIQKGWCQ